MEYRDSLKGKEMIKKVFFILTIFAFSFLLLPNNYSDDFLSLEEPEREVRLIIGEVSVFNVLSPTRVSIRNPEIADISKVTDKEVVVVAKKVGETALTIWDKQGEKVFYIIVYPQDLERVRQKLIKLINKNLGIDSVYYKNNEATGKVMIMGEVTALEKEQIERVLAEFFDEAGKSYLIDNLLTIKKESKMVEIECQVLELNKTELDRLGIKWMEFLQLREEPYTAPTGTSVGVETTLNKVKPWKALWPVHLMSRDALQGKINFLVRENKAKILSRPKLLCLSGQEAKLTVGGEVPYVSASTTNQTGTGVEIEYKDYGVILTLRPEVLKDDNILLNIGTEVSELDWANAITVSGINIPAFTTRKADTSLNIVSGDTVFIGGLIKNEESNNVDKLPALGNIPILGTLFRSKEFQNKQTELVITLTPSIRESKSEPKRLSETKVVPQEKPRKLAIYPEYLQEEAVLNNYILEIQKIIFSSLDYPRLAEEAGWQGTVKLKIHLSSDGEVIDIRVSESSGYVSFDNNVVNVVKSLSPYPPFPPSLELKDLWIDIPIVYKMD